MVLLFATRYNSVHIPRQPEGFDPIKGPAVFFYGIHRAAGCIGMGVEKGRVLEMETRITGTVKWFSPTEGVGLIDPDNGTHQDVLVHQSALVDRRSLERGERVTFDLQNTARGLEAAGVVVLGKPDGLVAD
jgi:CspA family cold shock protein